ncbi:MAG TPA: AlkA N-terminal domain-containing protein, partial [Verrucomicrobiae bacterium]|nr:AlkA N-terminal domain-containing protein [Verrucomicrobiae bacterium]
MILNPDQCYQAVLTRDGRFDGRFFVAVKSTRVYCRPVCRVKTPLRKSCTFFTYAAEAEVAGYRPCKRCRPELAPDGSDREISSQLARAAVSQISQDFLSEHSLADLAAKLGVTDRQMRRVFRDQFGVSPVEYWQTQRLLLSKQLLTDTRLTITSVALASGFRSLRRFNVALKERYRMTPTQLRSRQRKPGAVSSSEFTFRLSYRPPLDWNHLLAFLARRAIPQVEAVQDGTYFRTVQVARQKRDYAGFLQVNHVAEQQMISVRISDSLVPVCATILEKVKRVFDLQVDPAPVAAVLGDLAKERPGLRVPGSFDGFEL